jgi:ABC-type dipeptide/oligopeptide/nickel transport system permease subunit
MTDRPLSLNDTPVAQASLWRITWRNFRRHRLALASLILLIVLGLMAIFADQIAPFDPNTLNAQAAGATRGVPQPPGPEPCWERITTTGMSSPARCTACACR